MVFAFAKAYSQNSTSNSTATSLYNSDFKIVDLTFKTYIHLEISNSTDGEIHLLEVENGEYKEATTINTTIASDTLKIEGFQPPTFQFPQDKLSAHKVVDSKLRLLLPKDKSVIISTQEADIIIDGNYNGFFINQLSGSCRVSDLKSDFELVSIYGDVVFNNQHHIIKYSYRKLKNVLIRPNLPVKYDAKINTIHGKVTIN